MAELLVEVQQRLAVLEQAPLAEHVAVLGDVHRLLQEALAPLDEG